MRQEDHTKNIMELFRQLAIDSQRQELIRDVAPDSALSNWPELVAKATGSGLDNMDIPDLVRLAGFAKKVLKGKAFFPEKG